MAVTTSSVRRDDSSGNQIKTVTEVTLDSSYPTGGEPLTADDLGLNVVQDAVCQVVAPGDGSLVSAKYSIDDELLTAYVATAVSTATEGTPNTVDTVITVAEAADSSDLTDGVVQVTAWGYR